MAVTVDISEQDRSDAETFLESFLSENVVTGDFSQGSFVRDVVITAMSYTIAFLKSEAASVQAQLTVSGVQAMTDGSERDTAADALMSNWFLPRLQGTPSKGTILIHLSTSTDLFVPLGTRFFYTSSQIFTPDSTVDVVIPLSTIVTIVDANSNVIDRYVPLNVVAQDTGDNDITPATWVSFDKFNPFVTKVENTTAFSGGGEVESTDDFLVRAPTAITVRDLNSAKSITTTLEATFENVNDVVVIGAGDPEMTRDVLDPSGVLTQLHTGGYTDVYLKSSVVSTLFEGILAGAITDPRPEITAFTDSGVSNFTSNVTVGMLLKIYNALTGEPSLFNIVSVTPSYITVSSRNPFPALRSGVSYSIGASYPNFVDAIPLSLTGRYTNQLAQTAILGLPAVPIYNISRVSYLDTFGVRQTLTRVNGSPATGQYKVFYVSPKNTHSGFQLGFIQTSTSVTDGTTIRVEYDTLDGFTDVHTYITNPFNRISCANVLAKGQHPVYVSVNLQYSLKAKATEDIDLSVASTSLANFINTYVATETLAISDVITFMQTQFPNIGSIPPFTLAYTLLAPTGLQVPYSTTNKVLIDPSLETTVPNLLPDYLNYGISPRTTLVLTNPSFITITRI